MNIGRVVMAVVVGVGCLGCVSGSGERARALEIRTARPDAAAVGEAINGAVTVQPEQVFKK
jgi:hypothetical protein